MPDFFEKSSCVPTIHRCATLNFSRRYFRGDKSIIRSTRFGGALNKIELKRSDPQNRLTSFDLPWQQGFDSEMFSEAQLGDF
jgi:hypothetical protein